MATKYMAHGVRVWGGTALGKSLIETVHNNDAEVFVRLLALVAAAEDVQHAPDRICAAEQRPG